MFPETRSAVEYLFQVEDNVGIIVSLISFEGLSIIPKEISFSQTFITQRHFKVQGLTGAHPQSSVGSLRQRMLKQVI